MVTQQPVRQRPAQVSPPVGRAARLRDRWSWPGLDDGRWRLTLACGLATMASALALSPLLDGGWWIVPTALVVAVVCGAGLVARSLRVPAPAQPLFSAAVLLVGLTVLFARSEAVLGLIPGPAAINRLQQLALQGREFVETSVPPAGEDLGLLLLIAGGIGLTALVVDTLTCALDLPGATLLPLSGLFLVPWVIGHGSAPAWTFLLVALAWGGVLATAQGDWARRWAPSARAGRVAVGMLVTAGIALAALLGGAIAAGRDPLFTLGTGLDIGQGNGTLQIDELVTLRRSLVQNDDRQVMTVSTNAGQVDYLRLAVLDWFDGERWSRPPRSQLEGAPPTWAAAFGRPSSDLADYSIRVGPLGGSTLPSPGGTVGARTPWPVAWDQRSTLPVRADGRSVRGQQIDLKVLPMLWSSETLRTASMADAPSYGVSQADIADPTALVGPELGMLAAQVTQGAETPYDQAVALQLWFTAAGGFRYSTNIDGGSDVNALDTFLRERVGYCEQFAATMALMARSLGIPARVVVGFTSGRQEEGAWVIRGTDAHAWPELWMGAAGWIRFEPTPGAPTVRAPAYTREANSSVIPGVPTAAASPGATADGLGADGRLPESSNDAVSADALNAGSLWRRLAALVCVLLLLTVPALIRTVRRRRRAVGGPEQAFREVVDTARDHRLLRGELPTARATVAAIAAAVRVPDELLAAAIRASSAGTAVDVRAVIARATPHSLPGLERTSESDERPIELAAALGRICGAVERARYAMPQEPVLVTATVGTGADDGAQAVPPAAVSGPGPASGAERSGAMRPGSLAGDVQVVSSAVRAQAPRWLRVLSRVAPLSLLPDRTGSDG